MKTRRSVRDRARRAYILSYCKDAVHASPEKIPAATAARASSAPVSRVAHAHARARKPAHARACEASS